MLFVRDSATVKLGGVVGSGRGGGGGWMREGGFRETRVKTPGCKTTPPVVQHHSSINSVILITIISLTITVIIIRSSKVTQQQCTEMCAT